MIDRVTFDGFTLAGLPNRFEAGRSIVEAIGMKPAVEYLEKLSGHAVLEHERELVAVAEERLRQIPGIKILGPALEQRSVYSVSWGWSPSEDLGQFLDAEGMFELPSLCHAVACQLGLVARVELPSTSTIPSKKQNDRRGCGQRCCGSSL